MSELLQLNNSITNKPTNELRSIETVGTQQSIVAHVSTPNIPTPAKKIERTTSHKRPSNASENSSKRAKAGNISTGTSPQLLQQLMAPNSKNGKVKSRPLQENGKWSGQKAHTNNSLQGNNSVLMNLLVSGCDVSNGYTCFPRPSKVARV